MVFDDRAGKLQSENVRLIGRTKGEAPSITMATLVSQPKPHRMVFDDRAGKLHSENMRLIARMKGEAPSIAGATKPTPYTMLQGLLLIYLRRYRPTFPPCL